ncbi:MAG: hypothetical protein IKU96_05770, partial [Alistipes sp.]|nr:hypothetical protein [Alistipes sp.]
SSSLYFLLCFIIVKRGFLLPVIINIETMVKKTRLIKLFSKIFCLVIRKQDNGIPIKAPTQYTIREVVYVAQTSNI